MTLPDKCTYLVSDGVPCDRTPVAADYLEVDDLKGERLVASNCSRHDGAAARRYALSQGYVRRDRQDETTSTAAFTSLQGGAA